MDNPAHDFGLGRGLFPQTHRNMQRILIIEDEKRVADALKVGLEENGYQVMVAYDGAMGCASSRRALTSWSSQTLCCPR